MTAGQNIENEIHESGEMLGQEETETETETRNSQANHGDATEDDSPILKLINEMNERLTTMFEEKMAVIRADLDEFRKGLTELEERTSIVAVRAHHYEVRKGFTELEEGVPGTRSSSHEFRQRLPALEDGVAVAQAKCSDSNFSQKISTVDEKLANTNAEIDEMKKDFWEDIKQLRLRVSGLKAIVAAAFLVSFT